MNTATINTYYGINVQDPEMDAQNEDEQDLELDIFELEALKLGALKPETLDDRFYKKQFERDVLKRQTEEKHRRQIEENRQKRIEEEKHKRQIEEVTIIVSILEQNMKRQSYYKDPLVSGSIFLEKLLTTTDVVKGMLLTQYKDMPEELCSRINNLMEKMNESIESLIDMIQICQPVGL